MGATSTIFEVDGLPQIDHFGAEIGDFVNFPRVGDEEPSGAEAKGGILAFQVQFGNYGEAGGHDGLGLLTGEVVGLLAKVVQLLTEGWLGKPASQSGLGDSGVSGGLGYGAGDGQDRQHGLLAEGELGNFYEPIISVHFRRFGRLGRSRMSLGGS